MRVFIHTGHLSVDNGAVFPLTQFFDLAKVLGIPADTGSYYGDDSLDIDESVWPLVEPLLKESKLLYRIDRQHQDWQNVQTNIVRQAMRLPLMAEAA